MRNNSTTPERRVSPGVPLQWFESALTLETDECIIWPYGTTGRYGSVRVDGRATSTHRLALQRFTQTDGCGLEAAHGPCHNSLCMNARAGHVYWATSIGNASDRLRDGTHTQGEKVGTSRLTEPQVLAAFIDGRSCAAIAAELGVTSQTIQYIKQGRNWSWLTMPRTMLA